MRTLPIIGLTTLMLGLGTHAAVAEPPDAKAEDAPLAHQVPTTFAAGSDYWTPERMRAAQPLAAPDDAARGATKSATPLAAQEQVDIAPTPSAGTKRWATPYVTSAAKQRTWRSGGLIAKTAGKVFGTGGNGRDFVASGNVVTSADGDVVVTVGHALIDGEGRWSTNLVFVPAYKNGAAPYGKFVARTMFIWSGYYKNGAHQPPFDFGMLVVKPVKSKTAVQTVGGQGIRFNSTAAGSSNLLLGYPSNGNGGQTLQYCSGASATPAYGMKYALLCDMGGGSSGGPWFQSFNKITGIGYQISTHALRNSTTSYGSYFGPEALKTFRAAEAA
ncbi:trypsin-like serine peptidase [Nonomuraea sp. NPDC050451]|uniref:trypsin-like serine peptidase n=1 Tax=Nonomuraea sp. NPDC050451 TaxID=3364364 RepID=UPI0037BB8E85